MAAFDDKHVKAAIARLPAMATNGIRELRSRAKAQGLAALVVACDAELEARPVDFSADEAVDHLVMAEATEGLALADAVAVAFSKIRPPSEVEHAFLTWIAEHPGASYEEAVAQRGKGDVGLLIDHLIYDRFGCFRRFVAKGNDLSSLMLVKDRSGRSVTYTLRDEAREGLKRAGVL